MHTARDPSKHDNAAPILRSDVPFVGRYYVRRLLQAAGPRASYLAHDATHGEVVVRTLTTSEAGSLHARCAHEASVLQDLSHAGLAPLLEFGRVDDLLYWDARTLPARRWSARPPNTRP